MATPPMRGSASASCGSCRSRPIRGAAMNMQRRGMGFGGIRWWVLLLFAGYAAYYWFSNRVDDPLTGEKVLIDQSITPDDEKALGLQAWNELQQTERVVPPSDPNAQAVRG